ncbi:AraC family transcriptional regulator [Vibrio viridaestus]|uniref:AraC family transcriptional regulator n=1 Tax=Vibrio viridaestus TaxID=2487322 RepID=A0A3N9TKR8_9VIBR|nr:AraC family transcriptional regulator [Vibrio viridaestus]RQW64711.1 AraC family transcriptional regulator [Vibrio viridaestus]
MSRTFSTHDVRTEDSFDYWQNLICTTYSAPTDNKNLTQGKFEGSLLVKSLGASALMTRIQSTPIEYNESDAETYNDNYFICYSMCEVAYLTQDGSTSEQRIGDIVVYDNNKPFSYAFPKGDNQIVISVPHSIMNTKVDHIGLILNKTLKADQTLSQFIGNMIIQAWEMEEQDNVIGDTVLFSILDVLNVAYQVVLGSINSRIASNQADNISRVEDYILSHLGDHELSVEKISFNVHMSSRTISRLFSKKGTSVMKWVWAQRLKMCHKTLLSGQYKTVSEVAYQYGFSNMAHFSKLFKETYGVSPSNLREI